MRTALAAYLRFAQLQVPNPMLNTPTTPSHHHARQQRHGGQNFGTKVTAGPVRYSRLIRLGTREVSYGAAGIHDKCAEDMHAGLPTCAHAYCIARPVVCIWGEKKPRNDTGPAYICTTTLHERTGGSLLHLSLPWGPVLKSCFVVRPMEHTHGLACSSGMHAGPVNAPFAFFFFLQPVINEKFLLLTWNTDKDIKKKRTTSNASMKEKKKAAGICMRNARPKR